jgi:hypothetical protein
VVGAVRAARVACRGITGGGTGATGDRSWFVRRPGPVFPVSAGNPDRSRWPGSDPLLRPGRRTRRSGWPRPLDAGDSRPPAGGWVQSSAGVSGVRLSGAGGGAATGLRGAFEGYRTAGAAGDGSTAGLRRAPRGPAAGARVPVEPSCHRCGVRRSRRASGGPGELAPPGSARRLRSWSSAVQSRDVPVCLRTRLEVRRPAPPGPAHPVNRRARPGGARPQARTEPHRARPPHPVPGPPPGRHGSGPWPAAGPRGGCPGMTDPHRCTRVISTSR